MVGAVLAITGIGDLVDLGYLGARALVRAAAEEAPAIARGGAYALRDLEGTMMRTGRTGNLARRAAEHARDPLLRDLRFDPIYRTDVYAEQRGLEQILHDIYNPSLNKINPIDAANPRFDEYMNAARDYLSRTGR